MVSYFTLCAHHTRNTLLSFSQKCDVSQHKVLAVSVCPQSLPYFAAKFRLSVTDASRRLCGFLKGLGEAP